VTSPASSPPHARASSGVSENAAAAALSPDDLLALDNQVCFALVTAARNVVGLYRPILEPLGLTHPQYLVMLALWERSPRSLRELAAELALEPATLSPLVKRLQSQGLVTRARRGGDERVLDVGLTDAGRALRERALEVPGQVMASAGTDADALFALRDALRPFSGAR
jgi:DNA-binding MarR family transcriptional regulator